MEAGSGTGGNRFWVVADVGFSTSTCGKTLCAVKPIYSDPAQRTPEQPHVDRRGEQRHDHGRRL